MTPDQRERYWGIGYVIFVVCLAFLILTQI